MTKKILSLLLALAMCIGLCTVIASAAGTTIEVTDEASLADALENAVEGDTISLKNDITWASSAKALIDNYSVTIEGNGNTLTFTNSKFGIRVEDADSDGTVASSLTIQNLNIVSTVAGGRCINIFADGVEEVIIDNCTLDTTACPSGYIQPLTIGGTEADGYITVIKVNDTTVKAGDSGYGIISYLKVYMYIEGCTLEGWNALYLKDGSDESYVQISDSEINTVNVHSGTTNAFSAIAIESDGNVIDAYNTIFKCTPEGDQAQSVISIGSEIVTDVTNNEICIQPGCEIETETIVTVQDSALIQDNTILVTAEYAEQLKGNGYVVVVDGDYTRPAFTQDDFDVICPEHNPVAVESEAPVCAEGGFITYYVCNEDCCWGVVFSDAEGRICVAGNVDEYEPVSAEHDYKRVEKVEATLEAEGMEEHLECEVCGGFFKLTGEPVEEDALVIEKLEPEEENNKEDDKEDKKEEVKNPPTNDGTVAVWVVLASVCAVAVVAVAKNRVKFNEK